MASIRKHRDKYQVCIPRQGFSTITRTFSKLSDAREWSRMTGEVGKAELMAAAGIKGNGAEVFARNKLGADQINIHPVLDEYGIKF